MEAYEQTHNCRKCKAPVRITARGGVSILYTLWYWLYRLDAKCGDCLDAEREIS